MDTEDVVCIKLGSLIDFNIGRHTSCLKLFNRFAALLSRGEQGEEVRNPNKRRTWWHFDAWLGGMAAVTLEFGLITLEFYYEPPRVYVPTPLPAWITEEDEEATPEASR